MAEIRIATETSGDHRVEAMHEGAMLLLGRGPTREAALVNAWEALGCLIAEVTELCEDED